MTFRLTTFGGCRLDDAQGAPVPVPALGLVLVAFLADQNSSLPRRDLALFLWPQSALAAGTNLRSLLRRCNAIVAQYGEPLLLIDGHHVAISRKRLACDMEFREPDNPADRLAGLCDRVSREFLPPYGDGDGPVARWVRDVRSRCFAGLRAEFLSQACRSTPDCSRSEFKRAALLLLDKDPHDEDVRRHFLAAMGPQVNSRSYVVGSMSGEVMATGPAAAHVAPLPRIALLPPETSADAEKKGFVANALIEDLTIGLCASRTVSVVAPYTSEKIRASRDRASLLQQHGVIYALDTKRADDCLFAQLIFMPTDEVVWATRFRLDPDGTSMQRQAIAEAIHTSIMQRIGSYATPASEFLAKPSAYFSYLRGLQCLASPSLPSVRKARRHFKEAIGQQKGFAPGLAGLSRTLSMEWVLTARGDDELLTEAERLAHLAIRENEGFAGAYKELGVSQLYQGHIDDSLFALGEAERLSPHYADVLCSHADSLTHASRPADALEKITSAIALNPLSPDTYLWTAAGACYFLQEYDTALSFMDRMQDKSLASRLAAACWGMLGETAKARICRNRVLEDNPGFDLDRWLEMIPHKQQWQTELYREGLKRAGF